MVDVPIHQVSTVVQRTPLVDTVIFMVIEKSKPTKTPTPSTTQAQVTSASEFDPSSKFDQAITKGEIDLAQVLKKKPRDDKADDPPAKDGNGCEIVLMAVDDKSMQEEETVKEPVPEMAMDVKELVNDEVVKEHLQVLEWQKEPNADDGSERNWFNDLVNASKYPLTFDDLIGSTIDFTKFAKNHIKKENTNTADLKGPTFNFLKQNCQSSIELEYNRSSVLSIVIST
nr:hypothetical protein [Tanacetum cinerariifolium]